MSIKKTNFKKAVGVNTAKRATDGSNYGYLILPKGVNLFKEEEGKFYLDFMPYVVTIDNHPDKNVKEDFAVKDSLWYKLPFRIHKKIGVDEDFVVCPTTFGLKCPICEYRAKRVKEGPGDLKAEDFKAELAGLRFSKRNLYVVIPYGSKKHEEKPHIFDVSDYLFQELLDKEIKDKEKFTGFPDLEEGYTLVVRFEEKKFNNSKYFAANRIDFEARDPYEDSILDEIPNLDACLQILTYDELYMKFFDVAADDISHETEPPKEEVSTRRRKTVEIEETTETEKPKEEVVSGRRRPGATETPKEEVATSRRRAPAAEEIKEEVKTEPTQSARRQPATKKEEPKASESKCPSGHVWGVDCDEKDECQTCDLWDKCLDAKGA